MLDDTESMPYRNATMRHMETSRADEEEEDPRKHYFDQSSLSGNDHILQAVPWWHHLYRNRCCLCGSFVFLFVFIWWASATNKACWAKMSPAHSNNRNTNSDFYLPHMSDDSSMTEASSATVGKRPNQEIRFLVVGNFGRDGWCYQTDTAYEMEKAARTMKASFVINTGNAFFPSGIMSPEEEQTDSSWKQVYSQASLKSIKWYSALGEAEKLGDQQAVFNFAKQDGRFVLDAPFYDVVLNAQVGDFTLHLLFLDTTALIRTKKKQNDEQLLWLASKLESSNATLKIVIGFHTPFSDPVLSAFLVPILEDEKSGAAAYFSGRERSLQWYKQTRTHYFVSGAGAEMLKNENPFSTPHFVAPSSGFLACTAGYHDKTGDARLKVAFVSSVGDVSKTVDSSAT